jgi:hypothetical protein
MRRIGRAAAVSTNEQFVSRAQRLLDQVRSLRKLRVEIKKRLQRLSGRSYRSLQNLR